MTGVTGVAISQIGVKALIFVRNCSKIEGIATPVCALARNDRAFSPRLRRATLSQERVFLVFQAIYASRSESFLTIREVMRNSTATKAKKPHWALVVSEVAMKS